MKITPLILLLNLFALGTVPLLAGGPGEKPQIFTVKCPAKFVSAEGATYLRVPTPDGKNAVKIKWKAEQKDLLDTPPPAEVVEGQLYSFTVMLRNMLGNGQEAEMVTVRHNGSTLLDRTKCEVHQIPMALTEVPIKYGDLVVGDLESWSDIHQRFPHRKEPISAGVAKTEKSKDTGYAYVCPGCEAGYHEAYPADPQVDVNKVP